MKQHRRAESEVTMAPTVEPTRKLERISQNELDAIIERHARFRRGRMGGARAVLSFFDLSWLQVWLPYTYCCVYTGANPEYIYILVRVVFVFFIFFINRSYACG